MIVIAGVTSPTRTDVICTTELEAEVSCSLLLEQLKLIVSFPTQARTS